MSWSIGIHKNTLLVTKETVDRFNYEAASRYESEHLDFYLAENDMYYVDFNSDYGEHMDVLCEDWIHHIMISDMKNSGEAVFISAEGDNAGDIWGYRYKDGECTILEGEIVIKDKVF